jgi:hypothetical protein
MLELNISFVFHIIFIAIGCHVIRFFLNKLYDHIIEYKKKESAEIAIFNNENNILKEKKINIENNFNNNIKEIQTIINEVTSKNLSTLKKIKKNTLKENYMPTSQITATKKLLIDNYFMTILKKIN